MRAITLPAVGILGVLSCADATRPRPHSEGDLRHLRPRTWILRLGEHRVVGAMRLTFAAVPEDSRCPPDTVCVWPGNGVVELVADHPAGEGPAYTLRLNTGFEPRSGEAYGVRITLVTLQREPWTGNSIRPDDYRAELRLQGVDLIRP